MAFRCCECGREFDEPKHWKEDRGEYFGYPAYEDMWGCPYCYGDYEEFDEWADEEENEEEEEYDNED